MTSILVTAAAVLSILACILLAVASAGSPVLLAASVVVTMVATFAWTKILRLHFAA